MRRWVGSFFKNIFEAAFGQSVFRHPGADPIRISGMRLAIREVGKKAHVENPKCVVPSDRLLDLGRGGNFIQIGQHDDVFIPCVGQASFQRGALKSLALPVLVKAFFGRKVINDNVADFGQKFREALFVQLKVKRLGIGAIGDRSLRDNEKIDNRVQRF